MLRQRLSSIALLSAGVLAAACGGNSPPPGSSGPGPGGDRITGNERLGWTQAAATSTELSTFGFVAYVDNVRNVLMNVNCNAAGDVFECSSRLPPMGAGTHTIELASFVIDTDLESPRSAPLRVTVAGVTAGGADPATDQTSHTQTTVDGVRLRIDLITDAVDAPTAIAFTGDGRAFVGGRRGSIHLFSGDAGSASARADAEPAIELHDVFVTSPSTGGLLDLALDPAFERNQFVYALYTTEDAGGRPQFRIARFREAGGRLGERAVLVGGIAASADRPSGALAFGRDGKLYAAFDDGGAQESGPHASYNSKVLRMNPDGTTPDDQPSRSPIYAGEYRSPRGLDFHPVSGALWIADASSRDAEAIRVKQSRIALPVGTGASAIAFYRGDLLPSFQGNLLVAASEGRSLLRLRFDRRDPMRLLGTERLVDEFAGAISAVAVGPDGAIYVASEKGVYRVDRDASVGSR